MSENSLMIEPTKIQVATPKRWKVIIINDDVTPDDFVIAMLIDIFRHDTAQAELITQQVHTDGHGIAGLYDFEIAEVRSINATTMARANGFPLQIKIETNV
jgi:ATP-dependent Clp protease adaptor protein ClpS